MSSFTTSYSCNVGFLTIVGIKIKFQNKLLNFLLFLLLDFLRLKMFRVDIDQRCYRNTKNRISHIYLIMYLRNNLIKLYSIKK